MLGAPCDVIVIIDGLSAQTILHSLSNSYRAVSFWDGVSSMSFCTSFPNRGRRCIFPFAYIPIGRGGFAHFSAKIFKKIFQRHNEPMEKENMVI